jgi:hypothetical protein
MFKRIILENIPFENRKIITIYANKLYCNICNFIRIIRCGDTESITFRGGLFWTFFWTSKNVHFALCAPSILKHTKKHGCDHNAHKTHFRHQKHVTDFFGVVRPRPNRRVKIGH